MGFKLRNDFVNFDLDAFIRNGIKVGYIEKKQIIHFAYDWMEIISNAVSSDAGLSFENPKAVGLEALKLKF